LADEFHRRFGHPIDEESLNKSHQVIIVAAALDERTERIVAYLGERDIPINVLYFRVFGHGDEQLLSRAWLLDPARTQVSSVATTNGPSEPWNGEFYSSFGHGSERSWEDAVQYGFISAGGGTWFTKTLELLCPGDRVWARVPGLGFVGVGRITGRVQPAASFQVTRPDGLVPVLEAAKRANYCRELANDLELCEYFVPIRWLQTVPLEGAIQEIGLFGNQNTVCKPKTPKWRSTVERLKLKFPKFDGV